MSLGIRRVALSSLALAVTTVVVAGCGSSTTTSSSSSSAASSVAPLAGSAWVLTSYAGPDGTQTPGTPAPEAATMTFAADGKVSGSTGCNAFAGTYAQDGSSLTITPGPMTLKACSGAIAAQEAAVLAALPTIATFTATSGLELKNASGTTVLVYSAAASGLAGTSWQATGINNGKQAVVGMATTGAVTAAFGADGTLTGSGGCNTYNAPYTTSGPDGLTIGAVASTMMACEQAVMDTEQQYFAALGQVATYQFDGNTLTLRDASGATQVTFTAAK